MSGRFRVISTPAFEREFRKTSKKNAKVVDALDELIGILSEDPHGRSG
jgi:hypothetical protein